MDVHADKHDMQDMESGPKYIEHSAPSKNYALLEAAALLTVWSLLVINEGSIRLNDTVPSVALFESGRPSKAVVFFAALAEVFFGMLGFFVGVSAFMLKWYNTNIVKATMIAQTILGYYVFVIYVFVIPIFNAVDAPGPMVPGLSLSQTRAVIIMGLLTSFHFCLALQGGQFVFMARLIVAGTGRDFLRQKSGARMRAMFWNGNLAFSGLWTLITGLIVSINADESGKLAGPFVSPPNVGLLPSMTIWTGIVMLAWGTVGFMHALRKRPASKLYFIITAYVYLSAFLNYGIVQFGLFTTPDGDASPSGAVALHNGLVFMVVFLGSYFLNLMSTEKEGDQ